jgi:hypothetical protein
MLRGMMGYDDVVLLFRIKGEQESRKNKFCNSKVPKDYIVKKHLINNNGVAWSTFLGVLCDVRIMTRSITK